MFGWQMDDTELAVRISLGGTGIWCEVFFALYPGRLLRPRPAPRYEAAGPQQVEAVTGLVPALVVSQLVRSQRLAIVSPIVFFGLGMAVLAPVKVRQGMDDAGQDPGTMVL
jgi:hypothetical protein